MLHRASPLGQSLKSRGVFDKRVSWQKEFSLIGLTFFLIYGPKVGGWQSGWGDLISFTSILLIVFGVLRYSVHQIARSVPKFPALLFFILIFYSLLISLIASILNGHCELFYTKKFTRVLLNFLGAFALCGIYYRHYGDTFISKILKHIFIAAGVHGLIMLVEYVHDGFRQFVFGLTGLRYQERHVFRVPGLTISYGALSITQGFGLMASPVVYSRIKGVSENFLFIWWITVLGSSLFLAGRSGFYLLLAFTIVTLLYTLKRFVTKWHKIFMAGVLCAILLYVPSQIPHGVLERFTAGTLFHLLEPYRSYQETGELYVETLESLKRMYFLPPATSTVIFGSSISGRGEAYVPSDVGYVVSIFGVGILGTALMIFFYIYAFTISYKMRHIDPAIALLLCLFTFGIIVLNFKEQVLLTRHAFTISSLLICSWYFLPSSRSKVRVSRT